MIAAMIGLDTRATMDMDATIKGLPVNEQTVREMFEEIKFIAVDNKKQIDDNYAYIDDIYKAIRAGGMAMTYAILPKPNVIPTMGDVSAFGVTNIKINNELSDELEEPEDNELLDFSFGE